MASLGTLTVILGVDVSDLGRATTAMNSFAQRVRTVGYLTSATLTAPLVAAGKAAFDVAKKYEYSMQTIVGLTGTAQSEVNQWSDEIQAMGKEFGKMPQELAEALYFIASSGIHGAQALEVLRVSAQASAAGLGETQKVADLVTSALNAYAGTGLTAGMATDQLVAAVREGKAEADGFSRSMGQVIPIAAQLGVSFGEVAGGMAAITLSGASAANAAVWLKGVFNSLMTASSEGEKALKAQNSSYSELRSILKEQGLIALMDKLRELQKRMGDELFKDVLPNLRGLQGYLGIAGKNYEYNSKLINRVVNSTGALGKAFAAISDTIKLRFDKAMVTINTSVIDFGKTLAQIILPMIEKLASWIEELVGRFEALSESQKRFRIVLLLITAAIGPLLLLLSTFTYLISGLGVAFGGLNKVLLSNPWVLAATGVSALVLWLVHLSKRSQEATKANDELDKVIRNLKKSTDELSSSQEKYTDMTTGTFLLKRAEINEAYMKVKSDLATAYQNAGMSPEDIATGNVPLRWRKYIDSLIDQALELKIIYDDLTSAYTKFISKSSEAEVKASEVVSGAGKAISGMSPLAFKSYREAMTADIRNKRMSIDAMGMAMTGNRTGGWQEDMEREKREEEAARALRTQMTLVTELTNLFEGMFSSVDEGFAGMARAAISAIKQIATEILARMAVWAIMAMIFPHSAAFKEMGKLGSFAFARLGRGMASGGVVPPGYPNDTYPARLTSGEAVIPKGLLNSLSPAATTVNVIVDGKISGRDLALVMRRMNVSN